MQQYIPLFNQRRVIALRARSELTYKNADQTVPFYMQPVLGGSNDLRGFRPFRFYDDNLLVFNAEYRYEIFAGWTWPCLPMPVRCSGTKRSWNFSDLEGSYGVGMRFNARNSTCSCASTQASAMKVSGMAQVQQRILSAAVAAGVV